MDPNAFDEIINILSRNGRLDLIAEFKEAIKVDEDYQPPKRNRNDSLSESEGSAEEEEAYDVYVDQHGFQSLK
tara:strand:+ start:47 stop:265 length:219 start_codon:yes stop_codon:yes gene_type:complete